MKTYSRWGTNRYERGLNETSRSPPNTKTWFCIKCMNRSEHYCTKFFRTYIKYFQCRQKKLNTQYAELTSVIDCSIGDRHITVGRWLVLYGGSISPFVSSISACPYYRATSFIPTRCPSILLHIVVQVSDLQRNILAGKVARIYHNRNLVLRSSYPNIHGEALLEILVSSVQQTIQLHEKLSILGF